VNRGSAQLQRRSVGVCFAPLNAANTGNTNYNERKGIREAIMTRLFSIAVLAVILFGPDQALTANEANTAAVQSVLDKNIRSWETNDVSLFASIFAHDDDMVNYGTDAAERWVGWNALKESVDKQAAAFADTKVTVQHRDIKFAADGNVAWAAEVLDLSTRSGSEVVNLTGMRVTTVLEKRQGAWLIVHTHYSVPVAGQAIKY